MAEAGFWESSNNTLHIKLFSENFLENIQIFMVFLYLYLGLNIQEVRGQFYFYVKLACYSTFFESWLLDSSSLDRQGPGSNTSGAWIGQRLSNLLSTLAEH